MNSMMDEESLFSMQRIVIIGATSAMAEATARLYADTGAAFFLMARHPEKLAAVAADLRVRGARQVESEIFDADDLNQHAPALERAWQTLGGVDLVLLAYGTLPDQRACEASAELTVKALHTNAVSAIALLTRIAPLMSGHGSIVVLSSPAGDRGRQSNYVYGAGKAALSVFLEGLRNRLHHQGVHVLTVKPGFVDTPMTRAFPKGALWAQPEEIARGIQRAVARRADCVYLPWFWRWIMLIIRHIPESVFKRLSL